MAAIIFRRSIGGLEDIAALGTPSPMRKLLSTPAIGPA